MAPKSRPSFQPYSHPVTMYDVESLASPRRTLARRVVNRRLRWIIGIIIGSGVILYYNGYWLEDFSLSSTSSGTGHVGGGGGGGSGAGTDGVKVDTEDIWSDRPITDDTPLGTGKGKGKDKVTGDTPTVEEKWVMNEHGDQFRRQPLPPVHPDLTLLASPSSLFPEITDIHSFLKQPTYEPFPDSRLRDIISDPPANEEPPDPERYPKLPAEAYSNTWKAPKEWDEPKGEVRKVQWEGFRTGRGDWESAEEKVIRLERKEAVRKGFVWAWQKYKDHAWGHDEVKPVSKVASDPFNNWGASIIDTLDTLLILGLDKEYTLCRPFINQLNYHWVGGKDWAHGYVSADSIPNDDDDDDDDESSSPTEVWGTKRDMGVRISVFETGIRYLGGLLGAYDLSGDQLLVDRAVELAHILKRAFQTQSGLPMGHMDPGYESNYLTIGSLSIAEAGSMSLELMRLSQITRDRQWHDLAQRVTDFLEEKVIPRSNKGQLIPMMFQPDATTELFGTYSLGAMADSYYEYLIKTVKLLGNSKAAEQYKRIYAASVDAARQWLYYPIEIYDWSPLHKEAMMLGIGKREQTGQLVNEVEHLTCFAGGMLGLGARLLDRPRDLEDGERFTQTCYWLSASTPTGLQPEVVEFYQPGGEVWENVTRVGGHGYLPPPPGEKGVGEEVEERMKGSPTGSRKVVPRGINRPETIESIFYMYRLTGDKKWQEKGWKMFVSWMTAAKVDGGISSIHDVTRKDYYHSDNMESFMFAETLKYHFLLQSEPDVLSLDDYVLNTEAHPFIANSDLKPGSQRLYTPSEQDLGVRGQGTDAQKWARLDHLTKSQRPMNKNAVGSRGGSGGGGGMGAGRGFGGGFGGGRPDFKPQIPDEFKQRFEDQKAKRPKFQPAIP